MKGVVPQYATSDVFDLRNTGNELNDILKILKRLSQLTESGQLA
jgi:hypothetical protein